MFKLALDAGHGKYTAGKRCDVTIDPNATREWMLNSRLAEKVIAGLKDYEIDILRVDDPTGKKDIALDDRCEAANKFKADLYLSLHHNAGINGGSGGGIVVYTWKSPDAELKEWQKLFYDNLIAETGLKGNRSTPLAKSNFRVLVKTNMQAILVENGFMDSTTDTPIILTEEFANQAAAAYVKTIVKIGKLTKKVTEPPKETTSTIEKPENKTAIKENDVVSIADNAVYYSGKTVPAWVKKKNWIVKDVKGDRAVIDKSEDGKNAICSPINTKYLSVVKTKAKKEPTFEPYLVKVNVSSLNIRKGAGTNYTVTGRITDRGTYTIVDVATGKGSNKGWGKLKSGAGWISLDYCVKA